MLSSATLSYLSTQPDVTDQQVDALVEYAATQRPDAWEAIKLMHQCNMDSMIAQYLMRLQDLKLIALGDLLPHLWKRIEAYQQQLLKRQAEADMQPEAMQQQTTMQEMMMSVSGWMRTQSVEVCTTTICHAVEATVKADKVRCKQDWAGLVRLIREEGQWLNGLTNNSFVQMVSERCSIDKNLLPTESSLKVLSFGKQPFPAWKVSSYDTQQLKSLVQMASYFLQQLDQQVKQALQLEQKTPLAV